MGPSTLGLLDGGSGVESIDGAECLRLTGRYGIAECARVKGVSRVAEVLRVRETMTTSDFAHMADLIDRGVMQGYLTNDIPITYDKIGYRRDTTDVARTSGGKGRDYQINAPRLVPLVNEKEDYQVIDPAERYFQFSTFKRGGVFDISFEAWLRDNRDLGIVRQYPESWGMSARYTQEYVFTAAYAANATLFAATHTENSATVKYPGSSTACTNVDSTATGVLSATSLIKALTALGNYPDPAGNVAPYVGKYYLVVPPALKFTARQLVDPTFLRGLFGSVALQDVANAVLMDSDVEVIVSPMLPALDATYGNQAWYLFTEPRMRPAVRYGFLRGYEQPELWVKTGTAQRLASGVSDPFDGSFLNDNISFKFRFFFGADAADWRGGYMSQGKAA